MTNTTRYCLDFLITILRKIENDGFYYSFNETNLDNNVHEFRIYMTIAGIGNLEEIINLSNEEDLVIEDIDKVIKKINNLIRGKGCVENE